MTSYCLMIALGYPPSITMYICICKYITMYMYINKYNYEDDDNNDDRDKFCHLLRAYYVAGTWHVLSQFLQRPCEVSTSLMKATVIILDAH